MKTTIMIQARVDSKRLPNKVIASIAGKPMIWHIINRLKSVKSADQIILLTTKKHTDDVLVNIAKKHKILFFRGPENDVLKRYFLCAEKFSVDTIVRITGDCPLIDPYLIDEMIEFYYSHKYDYVSNTLNPTYPDGLDVEIFSFKTLKKTEKLATKKSDREHVTSFITRNKTQFKTHSFENDQNLSELRWTVDEQDDLKLIRTIYSKFRQNKIFSKNDVLVLLSKHSEISNINKGIKRNEGYLSSLKSD